MHVLNPTSTKNEKDVWGWQVFIWFQLPLCVAFYSRRLRLYTISYLSYFFSHSMSEQILKQNTNSTTYINVFWAYLNYVGSIHLID